MNDNNAIPDEELLYRGLKRQHIKDGNKISSAAFKIRPKEDGVSVDRSSLTTPREMLNRLRLSIAIVQIVTADVRSNVTI